jgi:hypothetical protein
MIVLPGFGVGKAKSFFNSPVPFHLNLRAGGIAMIRKENAGQNRSPGFDKIKAGASRFLF